MFELPHYFYKLHIYNTCGARLKKPGRRNKQSKGLENTYYQNVLDHQPNNETLLQKIPSCK